MADSRCTCAVADPYHRTGCPARGESLARRGDGAVVDAEFEDPGVLLPAEPAPEWPTPPRGHAYVVTSVGVFLVAVDMLSAGEPAPGDTATPWRFTIRGSVVERIV
jgi:hypothetical protein